MFVRVTALRYWKSERTDLTTCEDALLYNVEQGLFCVADGAGTTLFSNIWADALVKQFVQNPLTSVDPFEMEWWIRQAQKQYRPPSANKLDWNARQKALEQGAYSTLAAMHITQSGQQTANASLLAIGDSCIIIGQAATRQVTSFPLQLPDEFERAPYCVPAMLKNLNRYTLYPREQEVTLAPGDIVILATDAVARWIVSSGSGQYSGRWEAFLTVAQKTEQDWPAFIDVQRDNRWIVDDDSTALILQLQAEGKDEELLGTPQPPLASDIQVRQEEFAKAQAADNKELLAIVYGDGRILNTVGITLSPADVQKARKVADALRDIMQAVRDSLNSPNFARKIEPLWWQYADLLMNEPCAENVRKSLIAQGVHMKRPISSPPPEPPALPVAPSPQKQGGKGIPLSSPLNLPSRPSVVAGSPDSRPEPGMAAGVLPPLSGTQPEMAIIVDPMMLSSNSQVHTELELINRLRAALDKGNDTAILAVARDIESTSPPITLTKFEKQGIEQAQQRDAAYRQLLRVLEEGTAQQKVDADMPLLQDRKSQLPGAEEQLLLAHRFCDALLTNDEESLFSVYTAIEFSSLRKHFLFTPEEQNRIQQARNKQTALAQFRMILQSGSATFALLNQAYQPIQSLSSSLAEDERYIVDLIQRFSRLLHGNNRLAHENDDERLVQLVQLSNALSHAPYRFTFTKNELSQVRSAKSQVALHDPTIVVVNRVPITSERFMALYLMKPLYARSLIARYQKQYAANPPEAERPFLEESIAYWKAQIDSQQLLATVLSDLVNAELLLQGIEEETKRGNARRYAINFQKEVQKKLDDLFKDARISTLKEYQMLLSQFSEKDLRDSLQPIALYDVFGNYLSSMLPPLELLAWLHEKRQKAMISYYRYPEEHTQTTPDSTLCWLFKWWRLRDMQDEIGSV